MAIVSRTTDHLVGVGCVIIERKTSLAVLVIIVTVTVSASSGLSVSSSVSSPSSPLSLSSSSSRSRSESEEGRGNQSGADNTPFLVFKDDIVWDDERGKRKPSLPSALRGVCFRIAGTTSSLAVDLTVTERCQTFTHIEPRNPFPF
ncbi:hypothetical protein GYMLUDRAFT_250674 [Collybiopsis luxurians FD-317 M1]|uniref:Uncharacterized protein n=1 Tax=Collybiopsis luxurians FD-317 M1 TaxID=944289 RepID=A0A0D0BU11_9AGAR|nr:hypothetical protein GYMLUDRAFT_250674 [Collybiopsis luxurians FD-317 M1]